MKVSLEERISDIRSKIQSKQSSGARIVLRARLIFLLIQQFFAGSFFYLFFPSQSSFQHFNTLNEKQGGYSASYSVHRKRKRQAQGTTLIMLIAAFGVVFSFSDYLTQLLPTRAAACAISTDTTIDSTYISANSCDDISITADATLTFGEAVDLGGDGDFTFTVEDGVTATLTDALTLSDSGDVVVIDGTVTHAAESEAGVEISAGTVSISGTGSIDVEGLGCRGGEASNEDGYGPDDSLGGTCTVTTTGAGSGTANAGTGGSYGGIGGFGTNQDIGSTYGPSFSPSYLGSGGGAAQDHDGGDGGGLVRIDAANSLTLDGAILADGTDGTQDGGSSARASGGGSGGGIYITAGTFSGSGSVSANGGNGGDQTSCCGSDGSGGSGGKIAIQYTSSTFLSSSVSALGGTAGADANNAADGGNGSALLLDTDDDALTIVDGANFVDGEDYTRSSITVGESANLSCQTMDTLAISSGGAVNFTDVTWVCDSIGSLALAANGVTVGGAANIFSFANSGTAVDWDVTGDVSLTNLTYTGADAGTTSGTGGVWSIDDAVAVDVTNSQIASNLQWTNLTSFSLDSDSSIAADSLGCGGGLIDGEDGFGPATDTNICAQSVSGFGGGNASGGAGGGHGGIGGDSRNSDGGVTYDSTTAPVLYGSGGGATNNADNAGGTGGGLVRLDIDGSTDIDGSITANGGEAETTANRGAGGGSGGSIYVSAASLSGGGSLAAGGGDGGNRTSCCGNDGGGGGGGIVAIEYAANADFDTVSGLTATGGQPGDGGTNATAGADGVTYALEFTAPDQPTIDAPLSSSYNNDVNPILTGSSFSDTGAGHLTTDWKVTTDSGGDTIVWSATDEATHTESIVVNADNGAFSGDLTDATALVANTQYYAFVRYTNSTGDSEWSAVAPFITTPVVTTSTIIWNFDDDTEYTFIDSFVDVASGIVELLDVGGVYPTTGLNGWTKTKIITADNTGGAALTDFQVRVDVTHDGDMQDDFDDVRFTATDGVTEFDYYLESYDSGTSAIFWVEVPQIAEDSSTAFLMQYENTDAVTTSNGANTFDFFDDFETFEGWEDYNSGTLTQSSAQAYDGTASAVRGTANGPNGAIKSLGGTIGRDVILEYFAYRPSGWAGNDNDRVGLENDLFNGYNTNFTHGGSGTLYVDSRLGGVGSTRSAHSLPSDITDDWYIGRLSFDGSDVVATILNTDYTEHGSTIFTSEATEEFTYVTIRGGYEYYTDALRLRKDAAVTPAISVGSEEDIATAQEVSVEPSASGDHPIVDELYGISHALGGGNSGSLYYQIGFDSDADDAVNAWYYHDGSAWATASNDITDRNTMEELHAYVPALDDEIDIAGDQVFFKAFLVSNSEQAVELDTITLDYNQLPTLVSTIENQDFVEDETDIETLFDLDDYFADSAEETLSYSVVDDLDETLGTMTVNPDGTVDIVLLENGNGSDTVQFRATDQTGATIDSNAITIAVSAVNDVPELNALSNATVAENNDIRISVEATDTESSPLTLTALDTNGDFAAAGVSMDTVFTDNGDGTGTFLWTPTFEQAGSYTVQIQASDGTDAVEQSFTVTVGNIDTTPSFRGSIGNIAVQSGQTAANVFDLDAYFEDAEGDLEYAVRGNTRSTVSISEEGEVSVTAPSNFSGSEEVIFAATDIDENTIESDPVVIAITDSDAGVGNTEVARVQGSVKGEGLVRLLDRDGNEIDSWRAFRRGGAVPRLVSAAGEQYVLVTKAKSGSSIRVYDLNGEYIGRKKLQLHWRRIAVGNLNKKKRNDEVVAFIRKNKRIKMKAFRFRPNKKNVLQLKKRKTFRGLKSKKTTVEIRNKRVFVRNKKGRVKYRWRPFGS
jgi:hypothetical protein